MCSIDCYIVSQAYHFDTESHLFGPRRYVFFLLGRKRASRHTKHITYLSLYLTGKRVGKKASTVLAGALEIAQNYEATYAKA